MEVTILLPEGCWGDKIIGVYRIDLNNGRFYIGSSVHVRNRSASWKMFLQGRLPKHRNGRNVVDAIVGATEAVIYLLKRCDNKNELAKWEEIYLKAGAGLPGFVNENTYVNKPVVQYNLEGEEIGRFPSMKQAAKAVGCGISDIRKIFEGKRKTCKGFVFKLTKESDLPKPKLRFKRPKKTKELCIRSVDSTGNATIFPTITKAAKTLNCSRRAIGKVLDGIQKTTGGYRFELIQ